MSGSYLAKNKTANCMEEENVEKKKSHLKKVFTGETFLQNLTLLLVTATLSGLIIPRLADENQRTKARNDIIIQSQNKLLEDISKSLITTEALLADISFYGSMEGDNLPILQKAYDRYTDRSPDLLTELRGEVLRAKALSSVDISNKLDHFFFIITDSQDVRTHELFLAKAKPQDWQKFHDKNYSWEIQAEGLILEIANDLKLTRNNVK